MAIDDWDTSEIRESCPRCGSENVVLQLNGAYFFVILCKKCGFRASDNYIEII